MVKMLCFLLNLFRCIRIHKTRQLALTILEENCPTFKV
jgi:hypothetical protein